MLRALRLLVVAALLLAMASSLRAEGALGVGDHPAVLYPCEDVLVPVGPQLRIRIAKDTRTDLAQIAAHPELFESRPADRGLGFLASPVWVSLSMENRSAEPCGRWLVVTPGLQNFIRLHLDSQDGPVQIGVAGAAVASGDRTIRTDRHAIFPLVLAPKSRQQAYLELQGDALMQFRASFWEVGHFLEVEHQLVTTRYLLIGSSVIIVFASFIAALLQRRPGLLFGACAWVLVLLYVLVRDGYFSDQDLSILDQPRQQLMQFVSSLFIASHCLFTVTTLGEEPSSKRQRWLLHLLAAVAAILAIVYLLVSLPQLAVLYAAASLVVITAVLGSAALRGGVMAWTYLSGWILLGVTIVLRIGHGLGWFGSQSMVVDLAAPMAFGASAMTTSLALCQSVVKAQRETRAAERELLTQRESERDRLKTTVEQATSALQKALGEVQAASTEKSRFLSMVAHELNSPLHAILGNARLAQMAAPGAVAPHLEGIARAGNALVQLVDQTLRFSRGESLPIVIDPAPVQLQAMLDDLFSSSRARYGASANRLQCVFAGPVPDMIEVDEQHLRQVLGNMVDNALKYAPEGPVRLVVEARDDNRPQAAAQDDELLRADLLLRFSVQDQGPGIPAELHGRIFEPFSRLSPNSHLHGVGLGLAICQQLLQPMGSRLEITSAVGQGCLFFFDLTLPRVRDAGLLRVVPTSGGEREAIVSSLDENVLCQARELLELGQLVALEQWARDVRRSHTEDEPWLDQVIACCASIDLEGLGRLLKSAARS